MRREIKLKDGADAQKLASTFKVTTRTVYNALGGKTDTELSKKIRYVALKLYGASYIKSMPNEGVVSIHQDGVITHFFYGKTVRGEATWEQSLSIDTNSGDVKQYLDGNISRTYKDISINDLEILIKGMCADTNLEYDKYFKG